MEMNVKAIRIAESCIKCGKCVRVCPAGIMYRERAGADVEVRHPQSCIACGHCVDVCPTDSVLHSLFPPEKVHAIDYSLLPSPEQVLLLLKSRRSNRALTSRPVPAEMLNQIIEAARYAPTATNSRQVSVTLVTEAERLRLVGDFTVGVFVSVARRLTNPLLKWALKPFLRAAYDYLPRLERLKREHEAGNDPILRKATALLVFHTPDGRDFGCEDANLAYQNASIMAQSLGVSQIYMGFVMMALRYGGSERFRRITGAEGKIRAVMALGIPAFNYARYTDR